ncbi:MAG TPA: aldolase/citrate lyase family protein [Planctomycetaceae bacterium]|nr:aldolase/citrate lyase family protein [Planctomycetaceae bacterium]
MRTLKQRLNDGETAMTFAAGRVFHQNLLQIVGMAGGFHGVWLDQEHYGLTTAELEVATLACRAHGMDTFCRVAPTDYATVTRCLEAGSGGVMAAQIFTAKQAEEFVKWSKFAPRGYRGLNTGGIDARFTMMPAAEFTAKANAETFVLIQIETLQAVEECEAIAAIDGVDALFIGPADLSQSLGVTGQFMHEKCVKAVERIGKACRNQGKHLAAVVWNPQHTQMMYDNGCRLLSPTNDVKIVVAGVKAVKEEFAKFFA